MENMRFLSLADVGKNRIRFIAAICGGQLVSCPMQCDSSVNAKIANKQYGKTILERRLSRTYLSLLFLRIIHCRKTLDFPL